MSRAAPWRRGASRVAALFAFGLTAAFLTLLTALHLLEPQFNSAGHMISEYELGVITSAACLSAEFPNPTDSIH